MANKQIYIPEVSFKAAYIEEIGGGDDRVVYPGMTVELTLNESDFENKGDYHQVWILLTRAAQKKLSQNDGAS
jgi:hypothetical protein